jgi:hypothetical protein
VDGKSQASLPPKVPRIRSDARVPQSSAPAVSPVGCAGYKIQLVNDCCVAHEATGLRARTSRTEVPSWKSSLEFQRPRGRITLGCHMIVPENTVNSMKL